MKSRLLPTLIGISFGYFSLLPLSLHAQDDLLGKLNQAKTEIEKVDILNLLAQREILAGNYEKAVLYGEQSLGYAEKAADGRRKGESLRVIGKAYQGKNDFSSALNYYLQSVILFEANNDIERLADDHYDIGKLYEQRGAYQKCIDNLNKALSFYQKVKNVDGEKKVLNTLGDAYVALKDYPNASVQYTKVLTIQRTANDTQGLSIILSKMAALSRANNQYDEALKYVEEKYNLHISKNEKLEAAFALNNIGFLLRQKGEHGKSADSFNKALDVLKQLNKQYQGKDGVVLNNIGVTYTNLGDYKRANNYYSEALHLNETQKNYPEIANSYNYLAANDYISSDNDQALYNVQKAIEIGEANKCTAQLVESYQILSEIYAKESDFKRSQEAFKKHQELKDQLEAEKRKAAEAQQQSMMEAEKKESEFKLLIADKQKQELALNQLKLEAEKKEKDLELQAKQVALLRQEKELQTATLKQQALEREKVQRDKELAQQQLALAQKQLEDAKQKEQIATLEKQRQIQDLEKQEQLKAIQLIEAENKLKAQELEKEKEGKVVANIITALVVGSLLVILAIIAFAFRQRQKAARRLAAQNAEIEKKNTQLESSRQEVQRNLNELQKAYSIIKESEEEIRQKNEELLSSEEELRQNMEELQATYEVIENQKNQLETQNGRITHSIRYAERIQSAILPTLSVRSAVFPEHFLLYQPKDIVSGDFFWVSKEEDGIRLAAVIDCTGHGVPGAFMSMIGYTILNDTINTSKITNPAQILSNLNKEVRKRLKQSEGANNDGMDLGICSFENLADGRVQMTYAGAKHKLFVWTNQALEEFRSDRKMIGGLQTADNQEFSNTTILLNQGDIVYLTTDGYIDQANAARHSFGVSRFRELIVSIAKLPMSQQYTAVTDSLQQHQGSAEQRDDITVLAVKV